MRVALVPGVLALLPEYAGLEDPVADLRSAALAAAAWVAEAGRVEVVADPQGTRVAAHLLDAAVASVTGSRHGLAGGSPGSTSDRGTRGVLVVANGSARRTDSSPGYVDDRAIPYDEAVGRALAGPDPEALRALDVELGRQLLVGNPEALVALGDLLQGHRTLAVDYAAAPFGVGYWVARWESAGGVE